MTPTEHTIESLIERNAFLEAQLQQLTATFEAKMTLLQRRVDELLKRVYGRSSEKVDPDLLLMQDMLLDLEKNTLTEPVTLPVKTTTVRSHER